MINTNDETYKYAMTCGVDNHGGDIVGIKLYSLDDYNRFSAPGGDSCLGVQFTAELGKYDGTCFLKKRIESGMLSTGIIKDLHVAAILA
jgi:hypothetical protein